ncbi:MAG: hypothetical protein IT258_16095 [Saprospiraceae bacterium]|nr:hypothetical protein [Saprospiraceae bacterium]
MKTANNSVIFLIPEQRPLPISGKGASKKENIDFSKKSLQNRLSTALGAVNLGAYKIFFGKKSLKPVATCLKIRLFCMEKPGI